MLVELSGAGAGWWWWLGGGGGAEYSYAVSEIIAGGEREELAVSGNLNRAAAASFHWTVCTAASLHSMAWQVPFGRSCVQQTPQQSPVNFCTGGVAWGPVRLPAQERRALCDESPQPTLRAPFTEAVLGLNTPVEPKMLFFVRSL